MICTYDERMINHLQNILLIFDMVDMLTGDNVVFLHCLQSELLGLVFLQLGDLHISKCTYYKQQVRIMEHLTIRRFLKLPHAITQNYAFETNVTCIMVSHGYCQVTRNVYLPSPRVCPHTKSVDEYLSEYNGSLVFLSMFILK